MWEQEGEFSTQHPQCFSETSLSQEVRDGQIGSASFFLPQEAFRLQKNR